ncbi:MAG: cysteine hydrolase [Bacilli bacterium]|nr:cysteine hydrolase [Bacilli bacterium]
MKNLEELKKLLIVVDMVNGFVKEGIMSDRQIESIIPEQLRLIDETLREGEGLAFIKDSHNKGCREFDRYPEHCVKGTKESELVDELLPYEKNSLSYSKNSTSTIYAKDFINDIEKMKALREIIITGCCTDICVMNLAIPLQNYFDQIDRRVNITLPLNAVETYNSESHNRDEYNNMAFKLMEQSGIKLVKRYGGKNE